jgi:recombinational DNA repair protein (RecF pathway)
MALSSCPKCDSKRFEVTYSAPAGSGVQLRFVQCAACGAVVGVADYYPARNPSEMESEIKKLRAEVQQLAANVSRIARH